MPYYVLWCLSLALRVLPGRLCNRLGAAMGWCFYYFISVRRETVLDNLRVAFPTKTDRDREVLALRNYCHYGRALLDLVRSFTWNRQTFLNSISYHGVEILQKNIREGKGAFLLTLHIGNWELAIGATAAVGPPLSVVVKKGSSRTFRDLQERYRGRQGVVLLEETKTATDVLKAISEGRIVAFVLDQFMGPPIGLPVTFFGKEAGTAAALALLTERRPVDVILAHSHYDQRGKLHMMYEKVKSTTTSVGMSARLFEKTQFYNDVLEQIVRDHPEQWMWLHRRWKPYVGTSRWLRPAVTALLYGLMTVMGCSSQPVQTSTGIMVPEEQPVSVPEFVVSPMPAPEPSHEPAIAQQPTPIPAGNAPVQTKSKGSRPRPTEARAPAPAFFRYSPAQIPFQVGETMEIDLSWMALPAGRALLEVRQGPEYQGRATRWLWGNVLSSRLVDTIYHLENTIESFIDHEGIIPYKFLLHMVETHQKKETRVLFDHPGKRAYYWAKRLSQKWGDLDVDRVDSLVPAAKDMFSALYFSRMLDYRLDHPEKIEVFENGQNWEIELRPVANELVHSKAGAFQCWKLMIKMKLNNVLSQTGDIAMWLSDDSKRYLVKFDAKVKIGYLVGSLVRIREK